VCRAEDKNIGKEGGKFKKELRKYFVRFD